MNTEQNVGATPAEIEALVADFFEQMESKVKKARAWTFQRLNAVCDTQKRSACRQCFGNHQSTYHQ